MYRQTNRASFLGKAGCSCLATCYGRLVAIELALKDHFGDAAVAHHGHDVPALLQALAAAGAAQTPSIGAAALNSKSVQLGNKLKVLSCSGRTGTRMTVPSSNYPYMRYVLHEQDGTHARDVKERDLLALNSLADDILNLIASSYGVRA